jgi:hypothetical protein
MTLMRNLRPPKQSAAASAFVVIIIAVILFVWYLTLETGKPPNEGEGNEHSEQHHSQH